MLNTDGNNNSAAQGLYGKRLRQIVNPSRIIGISSYSSRMYILNSTPALNCLLARPSHPFQFKYS